MNLRLLQRRKELLLALTLLGAATAIPASAEQLKDWQDPKLTGLGNQPPRATMVACPDARTARRIELSTNSQRVKSPLYRSLWPQRHGVQS
jgi:hypothetical protein